MSEFYPIEFDPIDATEEEWRQYHEYRRYRSLESRPEDPVTPDEEVEMQMKKPNPFNEIRRFGIVVDGRLIAGFGASWVKPNAPGYESNKHLLWAGGSVHKDFRRRGIGTMWLRKALQLMEESATTVLTTGSEEEEGHEFLRWAGLGEKQKGAENRLDLQQVDWDMVIRWTKEGEERSPETTLEFHENRIPREMWEDFTAQYSALLNTMPFDDLDHGDIVFNAEVLQEHYERMDLVKGEHHTYLTRESDGTISGITDMFYSPSNPDRIEQQFTGVLPATRGRGLGKWLKAAMLLYVRDRYPDVRWVITGNANSNDPMLAINHQLGFREYKSGSSYQVGIEDLKGFLEKLPADKGRLPSA